MTRAAVVILVGIWLVSLPLLSAARVETWTDEFELWRGAQWWSPAKLRPTVELGRIAFAAGRSEEAERQFRQALRLWERGRPSFERAGCEIARENLVRLLESEGRYEEGAMWSAYPCVPR